MYNTRVRNELKRGGFIVSTDCVGRFGQVKDTEKVWGFAMQEASFLGLEVVAWKNLLPLLRTNPDHNPKIAGLHGKMGIHKDQPWPIKLTARIIDSQVTDVKNLIEVGNSFPYILIHSVTLDQNHIQETIIENRRKINTVFVENHIQKGALFHALLSALSLRDGGVNAGLMIDIVHCFNETKTKQQNMTLFWNQMISSVGDVLKKAQRADIDMPIAIHLPIGTNNADSLPFSEITPRMWQEFAEVVHKRPHTPIVLENQQSGLGLIFFDPGKVDAQRARNEKVFDTLTKAGVILV